MDLSEVQGKIELRQGDISEMEVDAIVNAANTDLILGAGVSGAIGRQGGEVIQEACDEIQAIGLGEAAATTAGALKAEHVIHAASMEIGHFAQARNIDRATRNALACAEKLGAKTIAFPAIGAGVAAFPADQCAQIMLRVVAEHLAGGSGIELVHFVLLDAETLDIFREEFERLGRDDEDGESRRGRGRSRREKRGSRKGGRGSRDQGRQDRGRDS
ncbi:MAG: macro domain-containing protein [Planctomycetota bacterium]